MSDEICDIYSKGVKKKLKNYWAAWLPTSRFQLGDIGILNGYFFEKTGSLTELGIPFQATPDNTPSPLEIVSESSVSAMFKLAGETNAAFLSVPPASAGVKIEFGSKGSFIVQCPETYESTIAEPMALQSAILQRYASNQWPREWAVITRIIQAPTATFLISNSANSGVEFSAAVNLTAGLSDLGKASSGLSFKWQRGDLLKSIGAKDATPFFQLAMVKNRLFRGPRFGVITMKAEDSLRTVPSPQGNIDSLYLDVLKDEEAVPES